MYAANALACADLGMMCTFGSRIAHAMATAEGDVPRLAAMRTIVGSSSRRGWSFWYLAGRVALPSDE